MAPNPIYTLSGSSQMGQQTNPNLQARLARVERVVPYLTGGGNFAPSQYMPIDSAGIVDGKLNLATAAGIAVKGIMSPNVVDGQFSVAKPTDSTATIYWDGTNSSRVMIIRRPDPQGQGLNGTSTTIPGSSITITGLTHDLTYQALPFWTPFNGCGIGFAPGTVGTPQIAFLSTDTDTIFANGRSIQSLMGREPLGNVSWTQPVAGGSSGGGVPITPPARQPGTCVMIGTHIDPLGGGSYDTQNHRQSDWVRIETEPGGVFARGLNCTPNHPLYDSEQGKVDASFFVGKSRWIITSKGEERVERTTQFIRACTKVHVTMQQGHIFFANGFMSHNSKNQLDQT